MTDKLVNVESLRKWDMAKYTEMNIQLQCFLRVLYLCGCADISKNRLKCRCFFCLFLIVQSDLFTKFPRIRHNGSKTTDLL